MIKFQPLQYYVDKLKNGEKFSFARYGDGELYCMWGARGRNSNRCNYSPELRQGLLDSMAHNDDPKFIYGLQRVLPQDEAKIISQYPDINWHDSEFLSIDVSEGKLFPLIEQLKKMEDVAVISNSSVLETTKKIINNKYEFTVPKFNAYEFRDDFYRWIQETNPKTILFSCGMAANAMIGHLHGKFDGSLLDLGHIWDPFYGLMSRCDLEGKTIEDINKNLHASN